MNEAKKARKRERIVDVRNWLTPGGTPATTVTVKRRRKLYATTTFHHLDGRRYLPSFVLDQQVSAVGEWREATS